MAHEAPAAAAGAATGAPGRGGRRGARLVRLILHTPAATPHSAGAVARCGRNHDPPRGALHTPIATSSAIVTVTRATTRRPPEPGPGRGGGRHDYIVWVVSGPALCVRGESGPRRALATFVSLAGQPQLQCQRLMGSLLRSTSGWWVLITDVGVRERACSMPDTQGS